MTRALGLDSIERLHLTLSAGTIAACVALVSAPFSASVAAGTAIEAVNYRVLRRATSRLFLGQLGGSRAWTAAFAARFVLLGAAMTAALLAGAHPVGLVLGLSLIVPAAVAVAWRERLPTAPSPPAPPPDDPSWDRWNPWLATERADPEREAEEP